MSAATPARSKRQKEKQLSPAELIREHQKVLTRAKKLYDRADVLFAQAIQPFLEICKSCGGTKLKPGTLVKGAHIALNDDGKAAILLDNFAADDIVWGHGAVRRHGLKIINT